MVSPTTACPDSSPGTTGPASMRVEADVSITGRTRKLDGALPVRPRSSRGGKENARGAPSTTAFTTRQDVDLNGPVPAGLPCSASLFRSSRETVNTAPDSQSNPRPPRKDHGVRSSFRYGQTAGEATEPDSCSIASSFRLRIRGLIDDMRPGVRTARSFPLLESRITRDLYDTTRFPEVGTAAEVRLGTGLCDQERVFSAARRTHAHRTFAKYIGVDPALVHPEDVPTVAFGGSGGGYRAMLAVLGYAQAAKESGLWDLITYFAGVSGSCWAIGAYYTFGNLNFGAVIAHCKARLSPHHPLSISAIGKLLGSPSGDYETLGPLIQKHHSGLRTVLMDFYSVFTTGYLFLQPDPILQPGGSASKEVAGYHRAWWTWSSASEHLADGAEPLPILTAIRHERPWKNWARHRRPFRARDHNADEHRGAADAWFQWFEMTPFEVGCDELGAWCPTWGFGRTFDHGRSTTQLPEQSLALLLGLCTSAPAGPLSSYMATIQAALPANFIGNYINRFARNLAKIWGEQKTSVFRNHHPIHACNEHNFMYHLVDDDVPGQPPIEKAPHIQLIDSGLDNNCPTYVMLHPDRQVDVILNMDASSDVQRDSFPRCVGQSGHRRGLEFRRRTKTVVPPVDKKPFRLRGHRRDDPPGPDRFAGLYGQIYDGELIDRPATVIDNYNRRVTNPPAPVVLRPCTMVYMPLLPNERAVPGYDPSRAKFSGSYNLVWTADQIDTIVRCSAANFAAAEDMIRQALREAWMRRRAIREAAEAAEAVNAAASASSASTVAEAADTTSLDAETVVSIDLTSGTSLTGASDYGAR